jgi:hypothetical protein
VNAGSDALFVVFVLHEIATMAATQSIEHETSKRAFKADFTRRN